MTTATKPLPEHGTYARANGSRGYRKPCSCEPCLTERRRYKKHDNANRQLGRPGHVDAAQARERLLLLNKTTGWNDLAEMFGGSGANLRDIAFGRRGRIKRTTHVRIMNLKPAPSSGQYIDATGSIRRIQALQAIGHTTYVIAEVAQLHRARLIPLLNGHTQHRRTVAERIERAYSVLSQTPGNGTRARNRAVANGWAPPAAWDDDSMDDPAAQPEWTGACGTDRGYWMHRNQQLPMCDRCEIAHEEWRAQHADIDGKQRNQLQFAARAAASTREADLAHDARELMRVSGLDYEQAAQRLSVSRQHLQQALVRHPSAEKAAA